MKFSLLSRLKFNCRATVFYAELFYKNTDIRLKRGESS